MVKLNKPHGYTVCDYDAITQELFNQIPEFIRLTEISYGECEFEYRDIKFVIYFDRHPTYAGNWYIDLKIYTHSYFEYRIKLGDDIPNTKIFKALDKLIVKYNKLLNARNVSELKRSVASKIFHDNNTKTDVCIQYNHDDSVYVYVDQKLQYYTINYIDMAKYTMKAREELICELDRKRANFLAADTEAKRIQELIDQALKSIGD